MNTPAVLKLASLLAGAQYIAHTWLFLSSKPNHGPDEVAVVDAMRSHRFAFGPFQRSYWDLYFGYGLLAILFGVVEVALLWQLATIAKQDGARVRPAVATLAIANVAHAVLIWRFFFVAPLVADVVVAACLGYALVAQDARDQA